MENITNTGTFSIGNNANVNFHKQEDKNYGTEDYTYTSFANLDNDNLDNNNEIENAQLKLDESDHSTIHFHNSINNIFLATTSLIFVGTIAIEQYQLSLIFAAPTVYSIYKAGNFIKSAVCNAIEHVSQHERDVFEISNEIENANFVQRLFKSSDEKVSIIIN